MIVTSKKVKIYSGNEVTEEVIAVDSISGRRVRDEFLAETYLAFIEMTKQEQFGRSDEKSSWGRAKV